MSYAQAIREQIVTARKRLGWSQSQLAEKAGIGQVTVSRIETTTRGIDIDEYVRIASALGFNAGDLLPNSGGLISSDIKPLVDQLKRLDPPVRARTLRIVEQVAGIQDDLQSRPADNRRREDNLLEFVPAKQPKIPTSDEQIDSLEKAMRQLDAEPRQARRGEDYSVPLIANLSAGKGLETFTREHESRDINAYYWHRGVRAVFRVVGNSMFDMGITDRDLVYVRPVEYAAPKNGEVIACTLNNESYVKVYEQDANGTVWLKSKANGFDPIEVKPDDDLRIWGVVLGRTGDL